MTDKIIDKAEVVAELKAEAKSWPLWAKLLLLALPTLVAGFGGGYYCAACLKPEQPAVVPAPAQPEPPLVSATAVGERVGPAKRLFLRLIRNKVAGKLRADGFNAIGGNPTPLSKTQAEALLDNLDDEQLMEAARASGQLPQGAVLDRLGDLFQWILDHKDQIEKLVKWILTLLAAFA